MLFTETRRRDVPSLRVRTLARLPGLYPHPPIFIIYFTRRRALGRNGRFLTPANARKTSRRTSETVLELAGDVLADVRH